MKNIIDYWPWQDKQPRKTQLQVFDWLQSLSADKKYILIAAPTGMGKSNTAITYSRYLADGMGSSYLLTPQKILQQQYEDSFRENAVVALYGRSNYTCQQKHTNCEIGSLIRPTCNQCASKLAFQTAMKSPNTVMNYQLFLSLAKYSPNKSLCERKLLVLDECHTIEQHIIDFDTISISEQMCKVFGISYQQFSTFAMLHKWLRENYLPRADNWLDVQSMVVDRIKAKELTEITYNDQRTLQQYTEISRHIMATSEITAVDFNEIEHNYIMVNEHNTYTKIKHIFAKSGFASYIDPYSNKILMMSSTILDPEQYCDDLGIDYSKVAFISVSSEFPAKNRPVFYLPTMKMNTKWNQPENKNAREQLLARVKVILNVLHRDDNGIIHTGNFALSRWLEEELRDEVKHKLLHHHPQQHEKIVRDDVIDMFFQAKQPTVLISPSITEGLDLANNKARFAIFLKVPFLNLGDAWVKKRLSISQSWYRRQAIISIIQGSGRIVRSELDYGNTYILDQSFGYLFSSTSGIIPEWWKIHTDLGLG